MRKVYCYAKKEEKPEEIDHSGDIVQDLSGLDISDLKNKRFFFIGGEIIENPYYEPSEYMKRVYAMIDAQYEQFYRSDKDKKDSEDEPNKLSSDDEMPDWIAEMRYGELIKRFPGGISEALEYAKKEKGLSVPEVHYNSPEPEKLGVKAFTKNAEVYLAPGEGEETLKHELGHVIQQKKEKIPATTKIGEQQVNLDPKLEQEADEFAKHIEDHIPELISEKSTNTDTKNIVQFAPISDEDLRKKILEEARNLEIPNMHTLIARHLDEIIDEFRKKESNTVKYLKSWFWPNKWSDYFKSYVRICITEVLGKIQAKYTSEDFKSTPDYSLYKALDLDESKTSDSEQENKRITEIMDMLSTEKIFPHGLDNLSLNLIMQWLNKGRCKKIVDCVLILKDCCDAKGIKSVLEAADINVSKMKLMLLEPESNDSISDTSAKKALAESFVKRLELMTGYIKSVYTKFKEKYWVQSTGSDPHYKGKHALFLINKKTGKKECVYKPHSLKSDAAVVGKTGIFYAVNVVLKKEFTKKCKKLGLTADKNLDALATMKINPKDQTEELIVSEKEMSQKEAELYFFRAGILKVITDVMAVTDLHQDNIMPTANGPLIIDAEVDFFRYTDSGLEHDALMTDMHGDGSPTNSTFTIKGGKDGKNIASGAAFRDVNLVYHKRYIQGYNFMLDYMKSNEKVFEDIYGNQLNSVGKVRVIPLATKEFADRLYKATAFPTTEDSTYIQKNRRPVETKMNRQEYASQVADEIETNLRDPDRKNGFIFIEKNKVKVDLNKNKLTAAIKMTFDNGTIIAMYVDMRGVVYLDDAPVGKIVKVAPEKGKKLAPVNKGQIKQIMRECFKKKTFILGSLESI